MIKLLNFYKNIFLITLVCKFSVVHAEDITRSSSEKLNQNSILWEISGKGLEQPSYLFGSWFLLCSTEIIFKEKVKWAIANSQQLMLQNYFSHESDEDYFIRMKVFDAMITGTPIYKIDDRKLRKKLLKGIDEHFDLGINRAKRVIYHVKRYTPFEVFGFSYHSYIEGCRKSGSFSQMLYRHFDKAGAAIESFYPYQNFYADQQASGMMSAESLNEHFKNFPAQQARVLDMKKAYYLDESAQTLSDLYFQFLKNEFTDTELLNRHIINIDSQPWLEKIEPFIQQKPTFISVNALHLSGNKGLINSLRNAGYTLKPL